MREPRLAGLGATSRATDELQAKVESLSASLRAAGRGERAEKEKLYLKSELEHYGVAVPEVRRQARKLLLGIESPSREDLLALVALLWSRPVHELRLAAVELMVHRVDLLEPGDLPLVEELLLGSRTWALVDPLAIHVAGPLLRRDGDRTRTLGRWTGAEDLWLRRAALLSYLLPMRRGEPRVFAEFTRHAEAMLEEREFFIRKALGWVLRERAKRCPDEVFHWLLPRAVRASGLTLREAARHLPEVQRSQLLQASSRASRT